MNPSDIPDIITSEGLADFHAAGRHTHITELLRNGATLPEARELARHSDIKMTMKYVHIGIDDQAKALAALPTPCQHIVSSRGDFGGLSESAAVLTGHDTESRTEDASPVKSSSSVAQKQNESPDDISGDSWRRRELLTHHMQFAIKYLSARHCKHITPIERCRSGCLSDHLACLSDQGRSAGFGGGKPC